VSYEVHSSLFFPFHHRTIHSPAPFSLRKNAKRRPSSNMMSARRIRQHEWQIRQAMGWVFSTSPPALLKQRTRPSSMASPVNHDRKLNSVSRLPQFTAPSSPPAGKKQSQTTNKMAIWPKDAPATGPAFDLDSELSELTDNDEDGQHQWTEERIQHHPSPLRHPRWLQALVSLQCHLWSMRVKVSMRLLVATML